MGVTVNPHNSVPEAIAAAEQALSPPPMTARAATSTGPAPTDSTAPANVATASAVPGSPSLSRAATAPSVPSTPAATQSDAAPRAEPLKAAGAGERSTAEPAPAPARYEVFEGGSVTESSRVATAFLLVKHELLLRLDANSVSLLYQFHRFNISTDFNLISTAVTRSSEVFHFFIVFLGAFLQFFS